MRYINRLFTYLLTLLSQIAWNESLKFGQLTLGKMIKIVATRCQILKLKPTKHSDVALTSIADVMYIGNASSSSS